MENVSESGSARKVRVYIAAPYSQWLIAKAVRLSLERCDAIVPVGAWIDDAEACGGVDFGVSVDRAVAARVLARNDAELAGSDAVIALRVEGFGGAMFSEVGRALAMRTPVAWTGAPILDCFRDGCTIFADWHEAVVAVMHAAKATRKARTNHALYFAAMHSEIAKRAARDEVTP